MIGASKNHQDLGEVANTSLLLPPYMKVRSCGLPVYCSVSTPSLNDALGNSLGTSFRWPWNFPNLSYSI